MNEILVVGFFLGFALAFANGANDVSRGIATLVGSGVTDYPQAVRWGTLCTTAGALLAVGLAQAMVATFGSGLLAAHTHPTRSAAIATLAGATLWVLFATRSGLPVSTTHAIVGSIAGVAVAAYGMHGVRWGALGAKILVPLALSPLISLLAVVALLWGLRRRATPTNAESADCLCASLEPVVFEVVANAQAPASMASGLRLSIVTGAHSMCAAERPQALRLTLDHLHWLTSGATSFARGMNDAPKIVALLLGASVLAGPGGLPSAVTLFGLVAAGMAAGGLAAGWRVTHVLAKRVTPMDHREGFVVNLVTSLLVGLAASFGLPLSTTHVSAAGIMGTGVYRGSLNWRTARDIGLAWVVTVPTSAGFGALTYRLLEWLWR